MFVETIDAVHEFRHTADADPTFNESTYYNFASPSTDVIGWLRIAIQPNQAAAQATALVFLPDGGVVFAYARTDGVGEDALAVGPISITIDEPMHKQGLVFEGLASVLTDGRALSDPGSALRAAPTKQTGMALSVTSAGRPFGSTGESRSNVLDDTMALGHYEQFTRVVGDIIVGDRVYHVDGGGLRDHSWGPRDWAGPVYYRWVTATMEDGSAFMALQVQRRDGQQTLRAAVCSAGRAAAADLHEVSTRWTEDGFCREIQCRLEADGRSIELDGTARRSEQFVPLRHRQTGTDGGEQLTRIGYGPYDFVCGDGRRGVGVVEALDQLIDGRLAGIPDPLVRGK